MINIDISVICDILFIELSMKKFIYVFSLLYWVVRDIVQNIAYLYVGGFVTWAITALFYNVIAGKWHL